MAFIILADHFLFEGRYREATWLQLRLAGEHINAELARLSPTMFGRN